MLEHSIFLLHLHNGLLCLCLLAMIFVFSKKDNKNILIKSETN
jgi:hypothetical protein